MDICFIFDQTKNSMMNNQIIFDCMVIVVIFRIGFLSNFVWIEPESTKMIHWNFHILVLKCEWNECFWIWFFRFSKIKNICVFDIWKQRILTEKKLFFSTTTNTFIPNIQNECFEYYICSFDVPTTNKRKTFSRITQ